MTQRLPCSCCGELILPDTAAKNGGLCMPCKGGYRHQIEAGKRRIEQERTYEQSAERKYWLNLVDRVHKTDKGFDQISPQEKTYFAVSCLIGEVYNGGFDQFFSNPSGALFTHALDGLRELDAERTAALLGSAKEALFGDQPVPVDRAARMKLMPTISRNGNGSASVRAKLEELDKEFWSDPDELSVRCERFAVESGLYKVD